MIYATAIAYNDGDTSNIFRPIDGSSNICGGMDSPAKNYPYIFFSNPLDMQTKRYCVKSCPTQASSGNWPAYGGDIVFNIFADSDGKISGGFTSTNEVRYESQLVVERVCIPSLAVFK